MISLGIVRLDVIGNGSPETDALDIILSAFQQQERLNAGRPLIVCESHVKGL